MEEVRTSPAERRQKAVAPLDVRGNDVESDIAVDERVSEQRSGAPSTAAPDVQHRRGRLDIRRHHLIPEVRHRQEIFDTRATDAPQQTLGRNRRYAFPDRITLVRPRAVERE